MRSDRTLRKWYARYNKKFFAGLLRDDTKLVWAEDFREELDARSENTTTMACTDVAADPPEIYFNPALRPFWLTIRLTLLHEMTHLACPRADHGPRFQAEIDRLYSLGAFKGLL